MLVEKGGHKSAEAIHNDGEQPIDQRSRKMEKRHFELFVRCLVKNKGERYSSPCILYANHVCNSIMYNVYIG